ncbi:hypothetical protein ACRASX_11180 [Flavobacterium sp. TMP13]|uniref:hypothetical protein n=1 Tax=Flavobacterium sp. TMP13 TaxID=3425950 RepID=UPI003D77186E
MYINLEKHHLARVVPLIEARIKLLRKRILKEWGDDLGDYDAEGLETKICEKNDEYFRLKQSLRLISQSE